MSTDKDRYAVIGNPVAHSKSPDIHAAFAAQTGQALTYERVLAPIDGFAQAIDEMIRAGFKGANVTVPFKLDAFSLSDELSDRARAAGAVNTLSFRDGVIVGDNTDGVGLVTDIVRNANIPLRGRRVLLVGAGGAARGVVLPLLAQQTAELTIANRTRSKADELVRAFTAYGNIAASDFQSLRGSYDVIINATSASLTASLPPLPDEVFGAGTLAYDMMYGQELTVFLRFASGLGAHARDGLGMLVEQAAESFSVWRGVRPDTGEIYAELRARLQHQ